MGKPGSRHGLSPASEHIGCVEGTRGSETSQYPQEEKTICDSGSSGERNRMRLNRLCVIPGRGCTVGVVGVCLASLPAGRGVRNRMGSRRACERPGVEGKTPVDEICTAPLCMSRVAWGSRNLV